MLMYLQELEKSLKTTCEEFIMSVTKLVVDPMLSFVTKVCVCRFSLSIMAGKLSCILDLMRDQTLYTRNKQTER